MTPCPEIVICVRETLDWQDEAAVVAGMLAKFRPKYEAWNDRFNVPYHVFRHRVTEIARENLRRVEGARVVGPDSVPTGALVVPVDDDDWFHPELARHLRDAWEPEKRGYTWERRALEAPPERNPLRWLPPRGRRLLRQADHSVYTCGTNNYAVVNVAGWGDQIASHSAASEFFDAQPERVRHIPRALSLHNRNFSSRTVLGVGGGPISWRRVMRRFRRYRRLYRHARLPAELAWANPYFERMEALMDELQPRW